MAGQHGGPLRLDQLDQPKGLLYGGFMAGLNDRVLNLYEAKTHLSALVDEAAAGREIIIAKAGRPMARLVPLRQVARRTPGRARGKIWMAADFDAPLPQGLIDAFEGKTER
jgi:prevent-host-death family protein